MALKANAIVGQSGGPTAAINATLSGIIRASADSENIEKLYGMKNGIEGLIDGKIVDISYLFGDEKSLYTLESTPAAALGSCRKKLPTCGENKEIYEKILGHLKSFNIRYLFYIGGNDSMDTVKKLSEYFEANNCDISVIGVPKTIDNDLCITDHAPGYGSAAKYVATAVYEISRDSAVYTVDAVTIIELMGRDAGWLACAAALPKYYTGVGADLVYLPEVPFSSARFISDVKNELLTHPNVVVAVSEGIKHENGSYVADSMASGTIDVFGHKYLGGASRNLEALVRRKIGCKVRSVELNLPQRCASHIASKTDIDESVLVGAYAVKLATKGNTGKMVTTTRKGGDVYEISLDSVDASRVAGCVRSVPPEFINVQKNGVTRACIDYISPLILGERKIEYKNGIPVHLTIK
ncbi:MAG: 6-phosphofructokinase [Clostridia bacterium]|nr:6-phosphofructokinase [Clostridia bacterium]